jgi:hypothetical protein
MCRVAPSVPSDWARVGLSGLVTSHAAMTGWKAQRRVRLPESSCRRHDPCGVKETDLLLVPAVRSEGEGEVEVRRRERERRNGSAECSNLMFSHIKACF